MIQGGGTLNGTYQYLDDGSVGVIFDYNGEELRYAASLPGRTRTNCSW